MAVEPTLLNNLQNASVTLTQEGARIDDIQRLEQLNREIEEQSNIISQSTDSIQQETNDLQNSLDDSEELFKRYNKDIKKKMNLVATRDRMLQLSQDRNVYKKKIIYVLFSVLIAIFITIIAFYKLQK